MDDDIHYDSPVLAHLDRIGGEELPPHDIACGTCPVSLWTWAGSGTLRCFCSALHRETWNDEDDYRRPILLCDGRTQALARLAAEPHS